MDSCACNKLRQTTTTHEDPPRYALFRIDTRGGNGELRTNEGYVSSSRLRWNTYGEGTSNDTRKALASLAWSSPGNWRRRERCSRKTLIKRAHSRILSIMSGVKERGKSAPRVRGDENTFMVRRFADHDYCTGDKGDEDER